MGALSDESVAAINLRLALLGLPQTAHTQRSRIDDLAAPLIARQRDLSRRLADVLCGVDQRVEDFLLDYLDGTDADPRLPRRTLVLDQPGMARDLSLPADVDEFHSELLSSFRLANGVLHNPANDRRTTAGVFHVAEGGLPIPDDKIAVPREVFGRLLERAFRPPEEAMLLPFTAGQREPAACFVSLHLQPLVVPAVPGFCEEKVMEIRFIAPGGLVSNLDFVESVFGNAGDPHLPERDASLDPSRWTGTTGLVVLAPHLTALTKKELGLPQAKDATERQRRDGMCWESEDERYNDGKAFKVCARDERGVIVTVIADNYFGYCKKEVKTQISYSANLFGLAEEEHAGGAIAFPQWNLGQEWRDEVTPADRTMQDVIDRDPGVWTRRADGTAIHHRFSHLVLVPAGARFSMRDQQVTFGGTSIRLLAGRTYLTPSGYAVHAKARDADPTQWHLVGTDSNATHCHKPATVSGGGKSEISKSLLDAFVYDRAWVASYDEDMALVQELIDRDYSDRFADPARTDDRSVLSTRRSLGSVIKLFTPSADFTDEYNAWLETIPPHVSELLFVVKRYYEPVWGDDWQSHFTVGTTNGRPSNALRLDGEKIRVNMLRVGFDDDGAWRLFSLRPDFSPAAKVQTEDDITASVTVPGPDGAASRKYVQNCETRLFQRPDDAVVRGYDKATERDLAGDGNFISNFAPLDREEVRELVTDAPGLSLFSEPMAERIRDFASRDDGPRFLAVSSEPRIVDGKRTKNPRYLQLRPDLAHPEATATADVAAHLWHGVSLAEPLTLPVDVVAAGRRNNGPEDGVPPLCAYGPLHYMELPELFMEFISSMTGKSPSTTGAGSEGALTKGPFNALPAIIDLNAALLAYALTEADGWVSSAGVIGPRLRVDHDISLLVPELFTRMTPTERKAANLIEHGFLERMEDVEHDGRTVQASRLGYRINERFVATYFARIFLRPGMAFPTEMLRPELQDPGVFAESVDVVVATHERVARSYFEDGTVELAVPPLRALLEVMAFGKSAEGWTLASPELRSQFTRSAVLESAWYAERLASKQAFDVLLLTQARDRLGEFAKDPANSDAVARLDVPARLAAVNERRSYVKSARYVAALRGTLGRQDLG